MGGAPHDAIGIPPHPTCVYDEIDFVGTKKHIDYHTDAGSSNVTSSIIEINLTFL